MRWITLTAVLFVAAPACGQENEAEKLFRGMERKVLAAKSLEVVFEGSAASPDFKVAMKGKALLGQGGLYRIDIDGEFGGKSEQGLMLCDGKTIYNKASGDSRAKTWPAQAGDADRLRGYLGRVGIWMSVSIFVDEMSTEQPKDFDLDKALPVTDFKLGVKEKVGTKDAQVIECSFTFKTKVGKQVGKMAAWIDTQTQLPLKRSIEIKDGKESRTLVETYATFNAEAKVDGKTFEVPK
jgi:outer membrane lipoprotein-sorting protein